MARASIVLLTNRAVAGVPALPLRRDLRSIAVIGPLADDAKSALGSWSGAGKAEDAISTLDGIRREEVEDLVVAVSEVVTNAMLHGRAPTRFRVWSGPDRIVVAMTDGGAGPKDPFAGLLPIAEAGPGGRGLWIVNQSCNHVTMTRTPEGFTLRLTAGIPH